MKSIQDVLRAAPQRDESCEAHGPYRARYIAALSAWSGCPACARQEGDRIVREHLNAVRLAAERARDAGASTLQGAAGLEGRLARASMDDLVSDTPIKQALYERLHRYVEREQIIRQRGVWALFAGGFGTGKTHAMAAMAAALVRRGVPRVLMLRASDVIDRGMNERGAGGGKTRYEWFVEPDFVFVDECTPSACEHPVFFDATDARYLMGKPIVFSGNAAVTRDSDAMVARSVLGDRIADRLFDNGGQVLRFNWTSLRMKEHEKVF